MKNLHSLLRSFFVFYACLAGTALLPQAKGSVFTGSLANARQLHTSTILANGKVLVAGGYYYVDQADNGTLTSAELYNPATGLWSTTGLMAAGRVGHTATLLANGKVLVVGGYGVNNTARSSAELYDPATGLWSTTGSMSTARAWHTATLLANGKVLVAGGCDYVGYIYVSRTSAELYDPATGLWSTTGSMVNGREQHSATLLANGKVLVAGGCDFDGTFSGTFFNLSSAELYNPATGLWNTTGSMSIARQAHTATLLTNGQVLVAAGYGGDDLSSAELYDAATGLWSTTGSLAIGREQHSATLLANGKVLVAGGYGGVVLSSAELYDRATGRWIKIGSLASARSGHTATLLASGKVLVAGGGDDNGYFVSTELYDSESLWVDYLYSVLNGAATITSYQGTGGAVTILSTLEGFPVTSIGISAFQSCSSLTSVTIPASVTNIGNQAFSDCSGLKNVTIPDAFLASISTIGLSTPVASKGLIDGIANNLSTNTTFINALAGNDAFVTAVANKIKSTSGNYGIATQSALSSALTESRADGINSVLSNPNLWTLYTTSQIQNMAVGDLVLTKNVGGTFTLNYDVEQSSDLKTWTRYQALSLPLTGLPTDKAFVRIKAKP